MTEHKIYKPKPISGFPEWLPEYRAVELKWIDTIRSVFESYGFCNIETPSVEEIDALLAKGVRAVLLKGGHLEGPVLTDLLATEDGIEAFESPRIESRHTHGTGCTLASAIACGIAEGMTLRDAVLRGRAYVRAAMRAAPGLGAGHGPLGHGVTIDPARLEKLA